MPAPQRAQGQNIGSDVTFVGQNGLVFSLASAGKYTTFVFYWFSQLFGMADHISFNLAFQGYQVVKYVPYGPIKEVVPYAVTNGEE